MNAALPLLSSNPAPDIGAELCAALGEDHVIVDEATVERVVVDTTPRTRRPSAVVYPGSTEEVRAVLEIAARHGYSVWPCSRGRNWGYGGNTPTRDGSITMVLQRMNRILHVDPELAYAVVEPGVTYAQLQEHLQRAGVPLWPDCTDGTPQGSVIGNALDKGIGETPYGDHYGNLCGLEVVMPDGRVLQTGGAMPDCQTWHTYKWGTGPILEGMFAQSNLGVVTRAGVWLMPKPACFRWLAFDLAREADLGELVDAIRELSLAGVLRTKIHLVNDVVSFAVMGDCPDDLLGDAPRLTDEARRQLRERTGIAPWSFVAGFYGSRAKVADDLRTVRRRLRGLGKLAVFDPGRSQAVGRLAEGLVRWRRAGGVRARVARLAERVLGKRADVLAAVPHADGVMRGVPTEYFVRHAYFRHGGRPEADVHPARDGCGLIWFAPLVPMSSGHMQRVLDLCRPLFAEYGADFYVANLVVNPRTVVVLMSIFYDKRRPRDVDRAEALYEALSDVTRAAGYQQYRVTVGHMGGLLRDCGTNGAVLEAIKQALDPAHVLAPGRYGIGGGHA